MLTRQELKHLVKIWSNQNGVSSDPETYNAWQKSEPKHFWRQSRKVFGVDRINTLSEKQVGPLNRCLAELFNRKLIYKMTEEEILGQHELVTFHIVPVG